MNSPIKVGDLVMVVRWPHKHIQNAIGQSAPKVFKVLGFNKSGSHCPICGEEYLEPAAKWDDTHCIPSSWLKRIDPLPESEDVPQIEELKA